MNFIGEACALKLIYPLRYFNDIWYIYISGEEGVSRARMVAFSRCPFEFSPLNKLAEKACALNTSILNPLRHIDDNWKTYISALDVS